MLLALLACAAEPVADSAPPPDLPGHNACLADGEQMSAEVCLAVVEADGRYPGVSEDKSGVPVIEDDPRLEDPELQWLTAEVKRCTCACCHTGSYGGPGAWFWDLEWAPVWTDSASLWSLRVFAGLTEEPEQTLPTGDLERVRAFVEREAERRYAAD